MFECPAGTSHEYTLPIPENVDEISYILRSGAYAVPLQMSILIKGVGTKSILKFDTYNCHEKCISGTFHIKNSFFGNEAKQHDPLIKKEDNSNEDCKKAAGAGGERVLTIYVDNLGAWMYGLKIFSEIRDRKSGKLLR